MFYNSPAFRTVSSARVSRRTTDFIGQVSAVPIAVTPEVRRDTVSGFALEGSILALEATAVHLVRVVPTIIFMVASPSGRYTLAVSTLEFGLRTFSVLVLTNCFGLVTSVSTVISEIAKPLLRYTPHIFASKVCFRVACWTILWQLIRSVSAIVFSITEQPFRYASVVRCAWASSPSSCTILLPTHVGWLIRIVTAIVVEIAHPKFRDASTVFAGEFRIGVARPVVAHGRVFVAVVFTIGVAIAFPAIQNTTTT